MTVLVSLIAAVAFTTLFRVPLKRVPWLFYALAIALDVLMLFATDLHLPTWFYRSVILSNARGIFAFWLFAIVMFMGVLPTSSTLRRKLIPIRAELSIFAALLCVGHMITLFSSLLYRTNAHKSLNMTSLVTAIIITALLVVLTVTSFRVLRKAMPYRTWKNIQRSAYVFFLLTYVHIVVSTLQAFRFGSLNVRLGIVLYGVATIAYVVLRIRRWKLDVAVRQEKGERGVPDVTEATEGASA